MNTVCIYVCCAGLCRIRPAGSPDVSTLWADNIQTTFFQFLFRSDFYPRSFFFWQSQTYYKKSLKNQHFIIWAPPRHTPALKTDIVAAPVLALQPHFPSPERKRAECVAEALISQDRLFRNASKCPIARPAENTPAHAESCGER